MLAVVPGGGREPKRVPTPQVTAPVWSGFVPAVTSGDFVFIAGQMARAASGDPDPRAHVPPHSLWGGYEIRRQTEYLCARSSARLCRRPARPSAGAVKAQVYLRHLDDTPHFLDVWNAHFGARQCALTIVPTNEPFGLVPGNIEINLMALTEAGRGRKEVIDGCIPAEMTFGAAAVRAGDLLLCSGMMAADSAAPLAQSAAGIALLRRNGARADAAHRGRDQGGVRRRPHRHRERRAHPPVPRGSRGFLSDAPAVAGSARRGAVPFTAVRVPAPLPVPACTVIADAWVYAP